MQLTLLQLKVLITGLKFEAKTGMRMSGKVNSYAIAKSFLGLPKNSRPKKDELIEALQQVLTDVEVNLQEA